MITPLLKRFTFISLVLVSLMISCTPNTNSISSIETRIIKDMNGRIVEIPKEINKIIAHHPGALRLICYLDATEKIIGVEANERRRSVPYLFAYPELKNLPIIGYGNNADPELLVALKPDVLICTYLNNGEADELQRKTGIPVICLKYGDFNEHKIDFYNSLRLVGNIVEKEKRGDFLINYFENSLNQITENCRKSPSKETVYIGGIAYKGAHGINSTEPQYAPFRFTQANNLCETIIEVSRTTYTKTSNFVLDKEQIIIWNPDKIFIDIAGLLLTKPDINKQYGLGKMLSAVQKNKVYLLFPHNWHTINYEHILINTIYIASILYPELYPNINMKEKANEVYTIILGKAIYDDMTQLYGNGYQKLNEYE